MDRSYDRRRSVFFSDTTHVCHMVCQECGKALTPPCKKKTSLDNQNQGQSREADPCVPACCQRTPVHGGSQQKGHTKAYQQRETQDMKRNRAYSRVRAERTSEQLKTMEKTKEETISALSRYAGQPLLRAVLAPTARTKRCSIGCHR